jgi:neutral trehalase
VYRRSLAAEYAQRAERRIESIKRFMWDGEDGVFTDYLWRKGQTTRNVTAATLYLLFLNIASPRTGGHQCSIAVSSGISQMDGRPCSGLQ